MEWIDIKDFGYPRELLADVFEEPITAGEIILARRKNNNEVVVDKQLLRYIQYEHYDQIPEFVNHNIQQGEYKFLQYRDGRVAVFIISSWTHFNDLIAYILVDDMLKELNKLQK